MFELYLTLWLIQAMAMMIKGIWNCAGQMNGSWKVKKWNCAGKGNRTWYLQMMALVMVSFLLADAVSNMVGSGPAIPVPLKGGEDGIRIDRSGTDGIRIDRSGKAGETGEAKRALKECWFDLAPVYRCGGVSVGDSECDCTSDSTGHQQQNTAQVQTACFTRSVKQGQNICGQTPIRLSSGLSQTWLSSESMRTADNVADELDLMLKGHGPRSASCR